MWMAALSSCIALQARTEQAQALFRNPDSTQFVIVTIPTVMAVAESSRLAKALKKESVLVKSLVMNQVNKMLHHRQRAGTEMTFGLQT